MRKILFTGLAVVLLSLAPLTGEATCTKAGFVERVDTAPGTAQTWIYLRTSSLNAMVWKARTADTKVVDAALNASTSRAKITMVGTAAVCPATGNPRAIGAISSLVLAP